MTTATKSPVPTTDKKEQFVVPRLSLAVQKHLADHGFVVVEDFLSKEVQKDLIQDVHSLRDEHRFRSASIGTDGLTGSLEADSGNPSSYKDIRLSETCFIGPLGQQGEGGENLPPNEARRKLLQILQQLKVDLQSNVLTEGAATAGVSPLDPDLEELMYVYYPQGGFYRRHVDAEADSPSFLRKYSFLLYLNQDWKPSHGGELRLHMDSGKDTRPVDELPNHRNVAPLGGTLVVFRSDKVPHEVLDTRAERLAIVGWYLGKDTADTTVSSASHPSEGLPQTLIPSDVLEALRSLRDSIPRLVHKLEPHKQSSVTTTTFNSGLLGDDFGFGPPAIVEPVPHYDDTTPDYWKPIAAISTQGEVVTLSLAGQRLRNLDISVLAQPALLRHATTLDFGNTDLPVQVLVESLAHAANLQQLHLGGNQMGDDGVTALVQSSWFPLLRVLDLRYNDLGHTGAGVLASHLGCLQVLYLEGNRLGNQGAAALAATGPSLRELYLGQNDIGPSGATALADHLHTGCLQKLYLEGNRIGPEGAVSFSTALENMADETKSLEKLYTDNNNIGKDEAMRLARALNSVTMIGEGGLFQS